MSKKNKIVLIILCVLNFGTTICLTIFVMPNKIPFLTDIHEVIVSQISKFVMLTAAIIPTIVGLTAIITKNKKLRFFAVAIFILAMYENLLYFSYFCISDKLEIGQTHEIPIAVSLFMPLSVIISVFAIKLKNQPYLSKPAINFKAARETEFLWKQTQFYAKDVYFATGIILFFISIIFCFVRFCLILFAIFAMAILISTIMVYNYSKSANAKYQDMKRRRDAAQTKKVKEN